jgi:hypothetical protein
VPKWTTFDRPTRFISEQSEQRHGAVLAINDCQTAPLAVQFESGTFIPKPAVLLSKKQLPCDSLAITRRKLGIPLSVIRFRYWQVPIGQPTILGGEQRNQDRREHPIRTRIVANQVWNQIMRDAVIVQIALHEALKFHLPRFDDFPNGGEVLRKPLVRIEREIQRGLYEMHRPEVVLRRRHNRVPEHTPSQIRQTQIEGGLIVFEGIVVSH